MKVVGQFVRRTVKFALGAAIAAGLIGTGNAQAQSQAPYLLPYTIQSVAGGGTSVTPPTSAPFTNPCTGPGAFGNSYDQFGDGCVASSTSVVVSVASDVHDVVVDPAGNVFFLDNTSSNAVVRRIDARSGIITVYAGTYGLSQAPCSSSIDKYGDGCIANDGHANYCTPVTSNGTTTCVGGGFTGGFAKARGLAVAKNGDLYIGQYSGNVVNRISAQTGVMTLVAGLLGGGTVAKPTANIGQKGYTGDGGPANSAGLNGNRGVAVDNQGNIYIADSANNVVRKVTASNGVISTIVGIYPGSNVPATAGSTGDGGPATSALVSSPEDVAIDNNGNIYVADFGSNKVRVVYIGGTVAAALIAKTNGGVAPTVGNIYTIMGGGTGVYTAGTTVLATSVPVGGVRKIDVDARGNVYLADNSFDVIWFLDASTGYMRAIAGTLSATTPASLCAAHTDNFGDGCPATTAAFSPNSSMGASVDSFGNIYVTDSGDARLRKVVTNQTFPATASTASTSQVLDVHFAAGDGPAASNGFVVTPSTDFSITGSTCTVNADTTQDCLLTVNFKPSVPGNDTAILTANSLLNGSANLGITGIGTAATVALDPGATSSYASALKTPQGIAQDGAGNVYIADTGNNRVLMFAAAGAPVVIAGTGTSGFTGDNGAATAATLNAPRAVAVTRNGTVYIADTGNNVIRAINPVTRTISTVGGGGTACAAAVDALGDGCPATNATLKAPAGLAADSDGNLYVADSGNNVVRELTASGYFFPVAGGAAAVCGAGDVFGNGCSPTQAIFANPTALQLDSSRNLYVADTNDNEVRKIQVATGTIVALAGTGQAGSSGNGGVATSAQLSGPTGLAVDAAGDVYIADTGNSVIRLVNAQGTINTTAGTLGASGTGTLPGSAFSVQLASPSAVVSNGAGTLVILDSGNSRAFVDNRGSVTFNFGRTNLGSSSPVLQIQETDTGNLSTQLSANGASAIFTPSPTAPFTLTGTGSTGCSAGQILAPSASCTLAAQFTPATLGNFSATYTESNTTNTTVINNPTPFISLTGVGAVLTKTSSATVVSTTGTPQYSVPFTVTSTVTPAACNTAAPTCFPTGTVTFYIDGSSTPIGLPVAVSPSGTASQSITGLGVGAHTVLAVYSGDSFYASSTAPLLNISVAQGTTSTTLTLIPATGAQFTAFNLSAKVSSATSSIPTGTVTFMVGTTVLGTASINAQTGVATLLDTLVPANPPSPAYYNNYGLVAGTYQVTAVYSGGVNSNYAASTSAASTLTITAVPSGISIGLNTSTVGTAQGSSISVLATVTPTNTLNGPVTLTCTNMPAAATCTFQPTSLNFTAVPGNAVAQQVTITIFTDVPAGVTQSSIGPNLTRPALFRNRDGSPALASLLGWPVLLISMFGLLGFRKRLRHARLLTVVALFGILAGGSTLLSGCSGNNFGTQITPVGTYNINFVAKGPNGVTASAPITFTVAPGAPGQF